MDIRVLNYFVTIVQTKSISNAAQALHITQPTLSRQIRDLEEELETVLFHRGSREIQLTEDGQYLYNRAIEILTLVNKTEHSIRHSHEVSGELYIGMAESQSLDIIAKAIKHLIDKYPGIKVHTRSGNGNRIQEELDQGILDFGITFGPYDDRKYDSLPIKNRDQWGVLLPKGHPLTQIDSLELKDIINYPLIVSGQSNIDFTALAGLGDYEIVATYDLLFNASLLVKEGLGIALCLGGVIPTDYDQSQLDFVSFALENTDPLQVIWTKQNRQSALAKAFLTSLEETLKENYSELKKG
ncbi:LysR family transcriptional regulator [Streptococcus loxodontisalivarius]|uniref:DNA-binding transcriptional LysR family regulator n=1 Tax=Streptococcus loxodontisalivarius TaxID=1349415 RepID=A0ABS2PRK3_9STRE|nr:LysR family transcriptional regulator [Streptococcus loxodontisalivarius]MBM7642674.1 DNA-binding transcriptional LysR family regulator [Streptococcus loxodontisalivarius]